VNFKPASRTFVDVECGLASALKELCSDKFCRLNLNNATGRDDDAVFVPRQNNPTVLAGFNAADILDPASLGRRYPGICGRRAREHLGRAIDFSDLPKALCAGQGQLYSRIFRDNYLRQILSTMVSRISKSLMLIVEDECAESEQHQKRDQSRKPVFHDDTP
jgi:hypothetical protein